MLSDGSGNYAFTTLISGGNYTVTPTKAAYAPGTGITTADVIVVQRQYLGVGIPLTGCRLTAADVTGNNVVDTLDVLGVQRFFLGFATGTFNTGSYQFNPLSRTYSGVTTDQTAQNYDAFVYGDVTSPYIPRPAGWSETAPGDGTNVSALSGLNTSTGEVPVTVALPSVAMDQPRMEGKGTFIAAVTARGIAAQDRLIGFQGDFTFDERVVTFQSEPVQKAGLTKGNWNVSGHVLDGSGPIRTLRVSAYSIDTVTPLSGSGVLFQLNMIRLSKAGQGTLMVWAATPNNFIFLNADLQAQRPRSAAAGRIR
jgi:hypothetical protein